MRRLSQRTRIPSNKGRAVDILIDLASARLYRRRDGVAKAAGGTVRQAASGSTGKGRDGEQVTSDRRVGSAWEREKWELMSAERRMKMMSSVWMANVEGRWGRSSGWDGWDGLGWKAPWN